MLEVESSILGGYTVVGGFCAKYVTATTPENTDLGKGNDKLTN